MDVKLNPRPLETHIDWHSEDVADPTVWTMKLTPSDRRELDHALAAAKSVSDNLLDNELVRARPDLVEALYEPLPYDLRGEHAPGHAPYYLFPVFTEHSDRLFVRFIPAYIRASQRHAEAPRVSAKTLEALDVVSAMA